MFTSSKSYKSWEKLQEQLNIDPKYKEYGKHLTQAQEIDLLTKQVLKMLKNLNRHDRKQSFYDDKYSWLMGGLGSIAVGAIVVTSLTSLGMATPLLTMGGTVLMAAGLGGLISNAFTATIRRGYFVMGHYESQIKRRARYELLKAETKLRKFDVAKRLEKIATGNSKLSHGYFNPNRTYKLMARRVSKIRQLVETIENRERKRRFDKRYAGDKPAQMLREKEALAFAKNECDTYLANGTFDMLIMGNRLKGRRKKTRILKSLVEQQTTEQESLFKDQERLEQMKDELENPSSLGEIFNSFKTNLDKAVQQVPVESPVILSRKTKERKGDMGEYSVFRERYA